MGIRYTNEDNYSLSIAVWLADDEYNHAPVKGPYISVTGLLKPLRQIILDQRIKAVKTQSNEEEIIELSRYVPSRLGTAIHSAIEHSWTRTLPDGTFAYVVALRRLGYPEKVIQRIRVNPTEEELDTVKGIIPIFMELRTFKKVGKWTIGGQFDFVGEGNLEDFKSMGVYGYMQGDKDEEQILQGSLYRWLNPKIITSNTMKIQQIFTDWSKLDSKTKAKRGYPATRILEKQLALSEMDTWVKARIATIDKLIDVKEVDLPKCTQKELWQADSVYKYFAKPEAKRATKVFDNSAKAFAYMASKAGVGEVKEFGSKVKRCGYCNGFDICTQKDLYIEQGILQMP